MTRIIILAAFSFTLLYTFACHYHTTVTGHFGKSGFLTNLLTRNGTDNKSQTNSEIIELGYTNELREGSHDESELKINAKEINPEKLTETNRVNIIENTSDQSQPSKMTSINETTPVPATQTTFPEENHGAARCQYNLEWTDVHTEPVRGDNHIIFLETRCVLNDSRTINQSGLIIHQRGACAVESAAKMNPNTKIYLIYTCSINGRLEDSPEYVKQMLSYSNVRLWKLDISDYVKDTPMENWDFTGKVKSSKWPLFHSSDILRYLTLWKYGGTYLDQDFVILKSLDALGRNYVGAQSPGYIASGALDFAMDTPGRTVAHLCLRDILRNFQGQSWAQNGPAVITRVLELICGTKTINEMTRKECLGFAVYPQNVFYTIPYQSWALLFDESRTSDTMKKVEGSYGVHVWNKMNSEKNIDVGSKSAYSLLAEKHCPRVYWNCGPTF
ncbi:lactosylceramide 4-alpha-galactosyltransferase-like isoform X2 [Zootermopsis nevadensis]|nr:lactosylceramide 4-alpha-galactosyltransferase-like isoform X2 [Zootermopsis nevadensis]XP_021938492.1 lactosylceramide 4-alpha-galactosyltransferase-like isoform X2 [Zootermopsis nevadensis]XP_021938493.1 lactosylceramide 4-alpha-galactosyltransferase-like isoform X2 [Zootermopsis nevadensis]